MRVGMYYNNRDVRVEQMPKPEIASNEILLKMEACGICGSDLMEWYRVKRAPLVLGHEATGEIAGVGKDVRGYKVGQRVFVSHHVPCNTCRYCLSGNHTACSTLYTTNYFPGGFSEYIRVPPLNVDRGIFVLPEEVSYDEGTFIEPLACVIRAQRISGFQAGQSVVILGSGISGLLHLLLARAFGAAKVVTTDISEYRLKYALELGADRALNANDDVDGVLRRINGDRLADLVVICASKLSAFNQAIKLVERAGVILCFAPTEPEVNFSIPVNDFWRKGIKIIHSYGAGPSDLMMALHLLGNKKAAVERLITHRLGLSEIGRGFRLMNESVDGVIKVIIGPDR